MNSETKTGEAKKEKKSRGRRRVVEEKEEEGFSVLMIFVPRCLAT